MGLDKINLFLSICNLFLPRYDYVKLLMQNGTQPQGSIQCSHLPYHRCAPPVLLGLCLNQLSPPLLLSFSHILYSHVLLFIKNVIFHAISDIIPYNKERNIKNLLKM
jgi:hypothetical protein